MTSSEQLILRGLNLLLRATFSPNDPERQAQHFVAMQRDIGPWLTDYATEIQKPVVDFTLTALDAPNNNNNNNDGGLQQ